jgi:hypothetical protein
MLLYPVVYGALTLPISSPSYYILLVVLVSPGPARIDQVSLVVLIVGMLIVALIEVAEHIALVVLHSLAVEYG